MKLVVGVTGASGSILAKKLLEYASARSSISVVMTDNAKQVFMHELGISPQDFIEGLDGDVKLFSNNDFFAPIASGSHHWDSMIIIPASMATVGKIANGIGDTLITRAADVTLKESRKLIIVPRETPLSQIHLRNMLTLSCAGAAIIPPIPSFYSGENDLDAVINVLVGRILSAAGIPNDLYIQWGNHA